VVTVMMQALAYLKKDKMRFEAIDLTRSTTYISYHHRMIFNEADHTKLSHGSSTVDLTCFI
jgi:hypothetical protein